jgi:hypothetical protein
MMDGYDAAMANAAANDDDDDDDVERIVVDYSSMIAIKMTFDY